MAATHDEHMHDNHDKRYNTEGLSVHDKQVICGDPHMLGFDILKYCSRLRSMIYGTLTT